MKCCHSSTDRPNDVPRLSTTVPTITADATTARVRISMMVKIRISAAVATISRS